MKLAKVAIGLFVMAVTTAYAGQNLTEENDTVQAEYNVAMFTAMELQLVLKTKCNIGINKISLIKKSPQFKKLISMKALKQDQRQYDKVLYATLCPIVAQAELVMP